jgi:MFS family permease
MRRETGGQGARFLFKSRTTASKGSMASLSYQTSHKMELNGVAATSAVGAMIAGLFAGSTLLTPLYIIYKEQFGFSQITLTLIYAVYVVGNLAALLLFGRLSDKFGRRRTAIPAIAITAVGALVFLFADSTASLYVGRVLSGLGIGVGAGTGTAWISELTGEDDKSRATVLTTATNFLGLALGAQVSGLLAQYASWPLRLPFLVYLLALGAIAALIWRTPETVARPADAIGQASLRPRLSVPREIRAQFIAPAITGFGAMALTGFYAAVVPSILAEHLHETNHAVAGALVLELGAVVAITVIATQRVASRAAMLWALALIPPSVGLLVTAQIAESMLVMIAATAACGLTTGLGYRGSLQVVNEIAPETRRAEVVSSYFVCCFTGNAVPVVGIGVLSTVANSTIASIAFAGMLVIFALTAFFFGIKHKNALRS